MSLNLIEADDMDDLWRGVNDRLLWAPRRRLDYVSSLDTMITDCVAMADSCEYTLNMGTDLWLTPVRWTTLVRQYLDPDLLDIWLDGVARIGLKGRGINAMNTRDVQQTVVKDNKRASRRKWGGCMRMFTYRAFPQPTVSMYSRTSYLGYIGGLDMMVAHKLAERVAEIVDINLSDIQFRWYCDTWQFHGFKSMAYIFASGQEKALTSLKMQKKQEYYPTWKLVRSWFQRLQDKDERGETYGEMKYSAERRIRRRWHAHIGDDSYGDDEFPAHDGPLDVPIETLSLDKVRR